MKARALAVILASAATVFIAAGALAETVDIKDHSRAQVKASCGDGVYWPSSKGGTYGCVNKDGSGIVCGGVTAKDKKTCDTFREAPRCLPTRAQAKGEATAKTQKK